MTAGQRTLEDWLARIGRERPADVARGLASARAVAERLGLLPPAPRSLIIAGTNGKGSTAVFAEALLRERGLRVGTTLSPHLLTFNERIRIDGESVTDALVCRALAAVDAARDGTALSYFEFATLAALWLFREHGVDMAVLEVGLGGRLDSVNIVDGDVTVITGVGLEHQALLGNDREQIALEKAGIMRSAVPLVFGEAEPPASIVRQARALGVPLLSLGRDYQARLEGRGWHFTGRAGAACGSASVRLSAEPPPRVALANAATALQAALLLEGDGAWVSRALAAAARVALPGRFDTLSVAGRAFILDVAHNPHAAGFLAGRLQSAPTGGRTVAIAGFLEDKDAGGIVAALDGAIERWWFSDTSGERGRPAADVLRTLGGMSERRAAAASLDEAIACALAATEAGDRILVLGSFDIVGRASQRLREGVAAA